MDDIIKLVSYGDAEIDEYGNEDPPETVRTVMCTVGDITRNEFYQAARAGLHPDITFNLSDFWDYNGEQIIRWTDPRGREHEYNVTRTYRIQGSDGLQIIATERTGRNGTES